MTDPMAEVKVQVGPAPVKAFSSAGFIQQIIAALPEGTYVTLAELVAAHKSAGSDLTEQQIYNNTQSLASRGKIGRGPAARTYGRATDNVARVKAEPSAPKTPGTPRAKKASVQREVFTNDSVFAHLEEQLGPRIERHPTELGNMIVLLGEDSGEYILNRSALALGKSPTHWAVDEVGPNSAVFIYAF